MYLVGRLYKEIYRVITEDIVTDEVILTEEGIEHIRQRHPHDFELYKDMLRQVIEKPDYILAANKPNTALVLKSVECYQQMFKLILRIKTSLDEERFKNSVITFQHIGKKRYERYLRNATILYARKKL